ncbi:MAG TPA: hypothetical protein PKK43_10935 [Spirochaetota bacterium]|nr:hypothetical protein [Spirochaetota bacterium]
MALSDRDINVIKLLALVVQMERATDKRFLFEQQFVEFVTNLSDDEKEIVNHFHEEMENTDLISMTLEQWIK